MDRKRPDRTVQLEILRAGPPHNQLLSPLTVYLGICGEASAVVLNVPWEHAPFERKLESLGYRHGTEGDDRLRRDRLDAMGRQVARLLLEVRATSGILDQVARGSGGITHLRLVLSASELGLVPFELCKVPPGHAIPEDNWLLLQSYVPISMTRHIRSVPFEGVRWPETGRVLFVASDRAEIPFEEHREVLLEAVSPWLGPGEREGRSSLSGVVCDGRIEAFGDRLTIIENASEKDVKSLCGAMSYSHVHVLAHGVETEEAGRRSYGISLAGELVSGKRFASALTRKSEPEASRPTVVSLASCDSANIGSVAQAGASFAHALHEGGIPLVVASQFPLSFAGSVAAVRRMYVPLDGLLWGASHPFPMLHELRRELYEESGQHSHDWASLVVYEAAPTDLPDQLEGYHYRQARVALKTAERFLGSVVDRARVEAGDPGSDRDRLPEELVEARHRCEEARETLPRSGSYEMESLGLRASNHKTSAEASFWAALAFPVGDERREQLLAQCREDLVMAYEHYEQAVAGFLGHRLERAQREASVHWVVVQMLSMGTVLGRRENSDYWGVARLSAQAYLRAAETDERAWAMGSLAELALLRLATEGLEGPSEVAREAIGHVESLVNLYPERGAWQIESTERQFRRYVEWWGDEAFETFLAGDGASRPQDWHAEGGVLDTANRICEVLREKLGPLRPVATPATEPEPGPDRDTGPAVESERSEARTVTMNGIDGSSGAYLLSEVSLEGLSRLARGEKLEEHYREELERRSEAKRARGKRKLRAKHGVDGNKIEEAGWGVVFAHGDERTEAILAALEPLLELRRSEAGRLYREFTGPKAYRRSRNESYTRFLVRHGMGPGPADPEKVPYHLLLIGSPEQIPYEFQYGLDVQYSVGRLDFETPEEYRRYAESVVRAEAGDVGRSRSATFFATRNPGDLATRMSADKLVGPLADLFEGNELGWAIERRIGETAGKADLARVLGGGERPALLFTASHGMGFGLDDERLLGHQGALLCQDWPGRKAWSGRIPEEHYFSADDLADEADVEGLVAFLFACYGAGSPQYDYFVRGGSAGPREIAPHPFVARLPQRLLAHPDGGALAVVGHVDRAWSCSFDWPGAGQQLTVFQSALDSLMGGLRVGQAMDYFNERCAELSTVLAGELDEIERGVREPDARVLAGMWTANNDARSYVLLGDPAVRLAAVRTRPSQVTD